MAGADIAALLDAAEVIVNDVAPAVLAEVRADDAPQGAIQQPLVAPAGAERD